MNNVLKNPQYNISIWNESTIIFNRHLIELK